MLVKFDLPDFTSYEAVQIARENYGLTASARPFPGEGIKISICVLMTGKNTS